MSSERKPWRNLAKIQRKISAIEQDLQQLKAMLPDEKDSHSEKQDELQRENEELRAKVERYKRRLAKKAAKEQVKKGNGCASTPPDATHGSRKRKAIDDASNVFRRMKEEDDCDMKPTLDDTTSANKVKQTGGVSNLDLLAIVASVHDASVKLVKSSLKQRHDESSSDGRTPDANEDVVEHDEDDRCACKYCRRPGNHKLLKWIQCDCCDRWYHCVCVWGKNEVRTVVEYSCARCLRNARSSELREFLTYDD
ncbi:lysine-specific demethylase 5A [Aphelenchoides avenae]|nr:lysine-specific demethylase 5A [Aphelenchus avenae]